LSQLRDELSIVLSVSGGRSDGVSFLGGFMGDFQIESPWASPRYRLDLDCGPFEMATKHNGDLTPYHLRLVPRAAVNALLTDGSERGFATR